MLNYIPSTNSESIPESAILATMEPNDIDGSYKIDDSLIDAKCIFLPIAWGITTPEGFNPTNETNYSYFAQVGKSFVDLPPYFAADQGCSVFPNANADKAFAASLLKHFFPIVGKSVIICGDSLTEQSATGQSAYSGAGTQDGNLISTVYGLGFLQEIARKYMMTFAVRGNGGCCWYPYVNAAADAENRNGCADVDAIVAAGTRYDYCIFAYGYNDATIANLGSAEDVASNETGCGTIPAIRYCIETMQENFPETKLLVVMPMYCGTKSDVPQKIATYYDTILPVLEEYHVRHVNMNRDSGIILGMGNADGIHLATIGDGNATNSDTEACRRYARCLEAEMLKL